MNHSLRASLVWIAAFAVAYVAMVVLNSVGGAVHSESMSYGSSRLSQEISGLARMTIHVLPAIAVAYYVPRNAWRIALVGSILIEMVSASTQINREGMPYVGEPLTTMASFVLLAVLAAYWMSSRRSERELRSTRAQSQQA